MRMMQMYVVMIKWGKTWTVSRRFSEFEALREKVCIASIAVVVAAMTDVDVTV